MFMRSRENENIPSPFAMLKAFNMNLRKTKSSIKLMKSQIQLARLKSSNARNEGEKVRSALYTSLIFIQNFSPAEL